MIDSLPVRSDQVNLVCSNAFSAERLQDGIRERIPQQEVQLGHVCKWGSLFAQEVQHPLS